MQKRIKSCAFFGNQKVEITNEIYYQVWACIDFFINDGCRNFYFTGQGVFDAVCNEIVCQMKKKYPEFDLKRVYCHAYEQFFCEKPPQLNRAYYDKAVYLLPSFYKDASSLNLVMLKDCEYLIFCTPPKMKCESTKIYEYAKKKKDKEIFNVIE